jgi:predicted  nucleic acid-binding Zn-ribbon protein
MSDAPTPETDAVAAMRRTTNEWRNHSQRLERERDDLLSRLTAMEHRMPNELARLERERDEALEQRDRLASTLETIRFNAVDDDIRLLSDQALAATKGGEP